MCGTDLSTWRSWVGTGNLLWEQLLGFNVFGGCDHVMIIIFKTEQKNSLDSTSHQEATQSRSEKGRDSGDRKSQAQQLVFMCQLWGLKTVTKLGYSRSSSETCLSEWMGGGNDITWPRNQRGSWHPRDKSWMFLWSFKLDPQPAWLEGLIRLKKKNQQPQFSHTCIVYIHAHMYMYANTLPP